MESTAQLNAENVERWVESKRQTARTLSNYDVSTTGNLSAIRERYRSELDELAADVVDIHYVSIGTASPTILTSTDGGLSGSGDRSADIALETLNIEWQGTRLSSWMTEPAVSHVYQREGTKRIAFVAPVEGTEREGSGAAVMVVANATASSNALENATEGGFTRAVDDRSIVELSSDPTRIGREYMRGRQTAAYTRGSQGQVGTTNMTNYARYLGEGLASFETDEEHEFVFQNGATGNVRRGED